MREGEEMRPKKYPYVQKALVHQRERVKSYLNCLDSLNKNIKNCSTEGQKQFFEQQKESLKSDLTPLDFLLLEQEFDFREQREFRFR